MRSALCLVLVACGGSSPPATHEEHSAEQEHAALPDAISRFHDVLAPLWHAEAGEARTERTCGSIDSLRARVEEVRTTPPPAAAEGDPAGWQVATDSLGQSVEELGTECAAEGRPAFEERLAAVHEAFHALAERAHGGAE